MKGTLLTETETKETRTYPFFDDFRKLAEIRDLASSGEYLRVSDRFRNIELSRNADKQIEISDATTEMMQARIRTAPNQLQIKPDQGPKDRNNAKKFRARSTSYHVQSWHEHIHLAFDDHRQK